MKICHGKPFLDYNKITNLIYLGNNFCCQLHFEKKLLKSGIKAVLSVEDARIDEPIGVKFYLWAPQKDFVEPKQSVLETGVSFLKQMEKLKIKTYVHCQNGHKRSPTVVAAFLLKKFGIVEKTISFIKKKRPSIHLTPSYIKALKKYQKKNAV